MTCENCQQLQELAETAERERDRLGGKLCDCPPGYDPAFNEGHMDDCPMNKRLRERLAAAEAALERQQASLQWLKESWGSVLDLRPHIAEDIAAINIALASLRTERKP